MSAATPRIVSPPEARAAVRELVHREQRGRCGCGLPIRFVREREGLLSGVCLDCLRRLSRRAKPKPRFLDAWSYDVAPSSRPPRPTAPRRERLTAEVRWMVTAEARGKCVDCSAPARNVVVEDRAVLVLTCKPCASRREAEQVARARRSADASTKCAAFASRLAEPRKSAARARRKESRS